MTHPRMLEKKKVAEKSVFPSVYKASSGKTSIERLPPRLRAFSSSHPFVSQMYVRVLVRLSYSPSVPNSSFVVPPLEICSRITCACCSNVLSSLCSCTFLSDFGFDMTTLSDFCVCWGVGDLEWKLSEFMDDLGTFALPDSRKTVDSRISMLVYRVIR